ncbi:MAG: hypothetical protein IJO91_04445 [Oscillospiraceae bacterium]|nr:hypothetical protein [Oscillospiraceae bacterium]
MTEDAQFCAFCGAKCGLASVVPAKELNSTSPTAESASPAAHTSTTGTETGPADAYTAAPAAPADAAAPIYSAPAPHAESIPQPQAAPASAQPFTARNEAAHAAPHAQGISVEIPVPQEQVKVEKYYTLGHIMLCLGAVAIMAIVAGVFAGLYFSVI